MTSHVPKSSFPSSGISFLVKVKVVLEDAWRYKIDATPKHMFNRNPVSISHYKLISPASLIAKSTFVAVIIVLTWVLVRVFMIITRVMYPQTQSETS